MGRNCRGSQCPTISRAWVSMFSVLLIRFRMGEWMNLWILIWWWVFWGEILGLRLSSLDSLTFVFRWLAPSVSFGTRSGLIDYSSLDFYLSLTHRTFASDCPSPHQTHTVASTTSCSHNTLVSPNSVPSLPSISPSPPPCSCTDQPRCCPFV